MNALNRLTSATFNVFLAPFELLGTALALILVSGLFGIAALLIFKQISWQAGIKATKDRIKGHMIAIRIYQDDLVIVAKSVTSVFLRNFQYLGLNFGPILPLFIPFMLVAAQFVVRYGFDPLPVTNEARLESLLPGEGTMLEIKTKKGRADALEDLTLRLPKNFVAVSPLVRNAGDGVAFQEVVAIAPGAGEIEILVDGRTVGTKAIVAGEEPTRLMQPQRVSGFWAAWLWPAEDTFAPDSPLAMVGFEYPERDLGWLPGGAFGILMVFFLASIVFGIVILKPLNIQI